MVCLMAATVIACGGSSNEPPYGSSSDTLGTPAASTPSTAANTAIGAPSTTSDSSTSSPSFNDDDEQDDNNQAESMELDMKATLPDDYPNDIFPIYPGSTISQAIVGGGGYSIIAHTNAHHADVIAFYKDVLKDASVMAETEEETSLTSFGSKDGYTYNIDVAKSDDYKGFKSQIWISIYK